MIEVCENLKNKPENELFQEKEDTNRKVGCGNDASIYYYFLENKKSVFYFIISCI